MHYKCFSNSYNINFFILINCKFRRNFTVLIFGTFLQYNFSTIYNIKVWHTVTILRFAHCCSINVWQTVILHMYCTLLRYKRSELCYTITVWHTDTTWKFGEIKLYIFDIILYRNVWKTFILYRFSSRLYYKF